MFTIPIHSQMGGYLQTEAIQKPGLVTFSGARSTPATKQCPKGRCLEPSSKAFTTMAWWLGDGCFKLYTILYVYNMYILYFIYIWLLYVYNMVYILYMTIYIFIYDYYMYIIWCIYYIWLCIYIYIFIYTIDLIYNMVCYIIKQACHYMCNYLQ